MRAKFPLNIKKFNNLTLFLRFISTSYTDRHKNTAHNPSTGLRTPDGP